MIAEYIGPMHGHSLSEVEPRGGGSANLSPGLVVTGRAFVFFSFSVAPSIS